MNNRRTSAVLALAAGASTYLMARKLLKPSDPPRVVDHVDLDRYLGEWFDIAHYPAPYQKDCVGARAFYSLNEDGSIQVINTCYKQYLDGPLKGVEGKARVADRKTNAKLKVRFFWPFSGDYWIIEKDPSYKWAVVSEPYRKKLWILARKPILDEATLSYILKRITEQGFDTSKLIWEEHGNKDAFAANDNFVEETLIM